MKYHEFIKNIEFGNYTAFVYDSPNNRYQYSSGEINDEVFANTTSATEFEIVDIDYDSDVRQVIIDNFLGELAPAKDVVDNNYSAIKRRLLDGDAQLAFWEEGDTTVYMLIFPKTYDVVFQSDDSSNSKGFASNIDYCKDYIRMYNGTNESYFEDYKGGLVQIVCNETEEVVYEEEVR